MAKSDYIRVKELLGLSNRLRAAAGRPALRSWWHLHRVMRGAGVPMRRAEGRAIFYERRAAMEAVEEWELNHRREHPAQAHVRMHGAEFRERFYELGTVARLLGRSRVWVNDRVRGYELRAVWHPTLCRLVVLEKDLRKYEVRFIRLRVGACAPLSTPRQEKDEFQKKSSIDNRKSSILLNAPQGGRIGATRQKPPKNAPQAKVASVPARTGKHGGRQAAKGGKKQL